LKIYILIDRSGSMSANWTETIGAVNAYAAALGEKGVKKGDITAAVFDNQEPFKVIRSEVKIKEWTPISANEVLPRGMTPLFDAIGTLAQTIHLKAPKKATIVVVTDGLENASREITKDNAKKSIDDFKTKGYDVIFIGADFDAFGQSGGLGVLSGSTLNMTKGNYDQAFKSVANRSALYASADSGLSFAMEFSDEDRAKAAGIKETIV
jgi:Mg-chelatase subunit ChlD